MSVTYPAPGPREKVFCSFYVQRLSQQVAGERAIDDLIGIHTCIIEYIYVDMGVHLANLYDMAWQSCGHNGSQQTELSHNFGLYICISQRL